MNEYLQEHPLLLATLDIFFHLLIFIAIVSIVVFSLRAPMRRYKPIDLAIFKKLQPLHSGKSNRIMLAITYLGKHQFLVPVNLLLIAVYLLFGSHQWYAFRILVMSLSSLVLMFILKRLFRRNRPVEHLLFRAKGKSFPSGHAMMSVCFYGLILHMILHSPADVGTKIFAAIFMILLILSIGFSRVYLQVHYASDVLAGFLIGVSWFYISLRILNKLEIVFT